MYVNQGTDQWEIPNYYGFGASSKKSGYFRRAVKQADIFTSTDFGYLGTQWLRDNKHSDMLLTTDNATYTMKRTLLNRNLWMNPLSKVMGGWGIWETVNGEQKLTTDCIENVIMMVPFSAVVIWNNWRIDVL